MSKILRLQNLASLAAENSNCNQKHGALITKGNRVYATGSNDNMRGKFLNKIDCCILNLGPYKKFQDFSNKDLGLSDL